MYNSIKIHFHVIEHTMEFRYASSCASAIAWLHSNLRCDAKRNDKFVDDDFRLPNDLLPETSLLNLINLFPSFNTVFSVYFDTIDSKIIPNVKYFHLEIVCSDLGHSLIEQHWRSTTIDELIISKWMKNELRTINEKNKSLKIWDLMTSSFLIDSFIE